MTILEVVITSPLRLVSFVSTLALALGLALTTCAQSAPAAIPDAVLRPVLRKHKAFVSLPNLPADTAAMLRNLDWVAAEYERLGFTTTRLPSATLPLLLAERVYDPAWETALVYFHVDGQPVNPEAWDQADPFAPVLKAPDANGAYRPLDWSALDGPLDDEWRVFARAAADDKAPILMLAAALDLLAARGETPRFNLKIVFDPEEEYGSAALLSTLDQYKARYASDYFVVMDGPAHASNRPTLTFGCRGIATCAITTYGAALPQHSGHMGNYAPNPVFALSRLLAGMKDAEGRVLVADYYRGVEIDAETADLLARVPSDSTALNARLGIPAAERVGRNYQEALQYPSLNVRQIGTSWTGAGLKTVIPDYARAELDLRLVPEVDGAEQLRRLRTHLERAGYTVLDRPPTDAEREAHTRLATFEVHSVMNAFRTDPNAAFGKRLRARLTEALGEEPVVVRMMGGTVPIVPLIEALDVPTVIVPMVNADNNQHAPNENIRVGNVRQGIATCVALLGAEL